MTMSRIWKAAIPLTVITGLAVGCATASSSHDRSTLCTSRLVYDRASSGPPQVLTMSGTGQQVQNLGVGHAPKWSPNGRLIAFDRLTGAGGHIFVMRADGKGVRDLTPGFLGRFATGAAWSPDGRWLAFGSGSGPTNGALWVVGADGSNPHMLVNVPGREEHPSWSPDGTRIVFDSPLANGPDHLYVVGSDGSGAHRITANGLDAWGADWVSPDVIMFANGAGSPTSNIYTIGPDGSGLRQLTHAPTGVTYGLPRQQSNGGLIAFMAATPSHVAIYTMTASGTQMRKLTSGQPGFNGWPDWSPCRA